MRCRRGAYASLRSLSTRWGTRAFTRPDWRSELVGHCFGIYSSNFFQVCSFFLRFSVHCLELFAAPALSFVFRCASLSLCVRLNMCAAYLRHTRLTCAVPKTCDGDDAFFGSYQGRKIARLVCPAVDRAWYLAINTSLRERVALFMLYPPP